MMAIKITKRVDPPSLVWQIYRLGKKKGGCEYDRLMLKGKNLCWCNLLATVTHMCELHGKWNNCINGPVSHSWKYGYQSSAWQNCSDDVQIWGKQ